MLPAEFPDLTKLPEWSRLYCSWH